MEYNKTVVYIILIQHNLINEAAIQNIEKCMETNNSCKTI